MNTKIIIRLTSILTLSYLRSRRRKVRRWIKPGLLIIISAAVFPAATLMAYWFTGFVAAFFDPVEQIIQALSSMPLILLALVMTYGVVFELGRERGSVIHAVNWLPITPSEYVMASTISIILYIMPFFSAYLGGVFGASISVGLTIIGVVSILLSILSMMMGGFLIEILKTLLGRMSSSLYRSRGRTVIIIRLILTTFLILLFMLITNPGFLSSLLDMLTGTIENLWMIPIFWPSLAVMEASDNLIRSATYSSSSLLFTWIMFKVGVILRARYWSPSEPSLKLGRREYHPRKNILVRLGFSSKESAIVRKDVRMFFRRRETASLLALPIILTVIPFLSGSTS